MLSSWAQFLFCQKRLEPTSPGLQPSPRKLVHTICNPDGRKSPFTLLRGRKIPQWQLRKGVPRWKVIERLLIELKLQRERTDVTEQVLLHVWGPGHRALSNHKEDTKLLPTGTADQTPASTPPQTAEATRARGVCEAVTAQRSPDRQGTSS